MSLFKKITDFVMPVDDEEEEEEVEEKVEKPVLQTVSKTSVQEEEIEEVPLRKVATGSGTYDYVPSYGGYSSASPIKDGFRPSYAPPTAANSQRPQLTVHTTKKEEISLQLCTPSEYSHAANVADDLGKGCAVIVNYEKVAPDLQRRMCDFTNGVCYAIDGDVKRISDNIVIYVPEGIDVGDAMTLSSMMSR